jgi:hypothetical protein
VVSRYYRSSGDATLNIFPRRMRDDTLNKSPRYDLI